MHNNEDISDGLLVTGFLIGEAAFGVDAHLVQEVVKVGEITRVYDAPSGVVGIRNLRGRIVTVLDMAVHLGLGGVELGPESRLLIMEHNGEHFGFLVDSVSDAMAFIFRRVISEVLSSIPGVEVVGQAANGKVAVQKVHELKPDMITLDMEMPEMDGLATLDELRTSGATPEIIVVSSLTKRGSQITLQAMEKGAFDFITKPNEGSPEDNKDSLRASLVPRIGALSLRVSVRKNLRASEPAPTSTHEPASGVSRDRMEEIGKKMRAIADTSRPRIVLIGVSTGGPNALSRVIPSLPANLGVPVLIVQHMPAVFTASLAETLNSRSALTVKEAEDGDEVKQGVVYLAPGGRHMRFHRSADGRNVLRVTDDPPENNCRPSVDYLFRSVSNNFSGSSLGLVLTGMGNDGLMGIKLLKRKGCLVLAHKAAPPCSY